MKVNIIKWVKTESKVAKNVKKKQKSNWPVKN